MVCFQAVYAKQALDFISNRQSSRTTIFRRGKLAFAITDGSADSSLNIREFDRGYEKFTEIFDFSVRSAWYQGLIYIDCMMERQDWLRLEKFILECRFDPNDLFLQGVCLRLEQIAATQPDEDIRNGAIKFLHALGTQSSHSIQQVAQYVLRRLEIKSRTGLPMYSGVSNVPKETTDCDLLRAKENDFLQVWDPLWYVSDKDPLLEAMQFKNIDHWVLKNLNPIFREPSREFQSYSPEMRKYVTDGSELTGTQIEQILQSNLEKATNLSIPSEQDEVGAALKKYYEPYLNIQRVSGKKLSLDSCYVNLVIVAAPDQRRKDKEELQELKEKLGRTCSFKELNRNDFQASIPLEELFDKHRLRDGRNDVPKRILVQGRAGVGKTTLCKKIVHDFQNGLWRDLFDSVVWLPLRQLRALNARNPGDLFREKYFNLTLESEKSSLASALSGRVRDGNVLFILDGLDEIVTDAQSSDNISLREFLKHLLDQKNVIITSRPSGIDTSMLKNLDLELETSGFNPNNIRDYLSIALDPDAVKVVQDFIESTCNSWDLLPLDGDSVTMTGLYQIMVDKLWRKDGERLGKKPDGVELTPPEIRRLSTNQVNRLMANEIEFLGYLAFRGLQDNQIEFKESFLLDVMEELDIHRNDNDKDFLPVHLPEMLKQTSFLHTADADVDSGDDDFNRAWYFLHLTFQEYFAATWLSRHLQANQRSSKALSMLMMTTEESEAFIQQNKYNPRYEIVWWMMAGQLEGVTLGRFFDLLQGAPRDLIGGYHQQLLAGCLKEARSRLDKEVVMTLETELMQWLDFEMALYGERECKGMLGKQSVFPEELLARCLNETKEVQMYALKAMKGRAHWTSSSVDGLIASLQDEDNDISALASEALSTQSNLPESAVKALVMAVHGERSYASYAAAKALGNQSLLTDFNISGLMSGFKFHEVESKYYLAQAISSQLKMRGPVLQGHDSEAQQAAAEVLGAQSSLPVRAILGLGTVSNNAEDLDVKISAARALRAHTKSSKLIYVRFREEKIPDLVDALKAENYRERITAAVALGINPELPEFAVTALIGVLNNTSAGVIKSAIRSLCAQSELNESAIQKLVDKSKGFNIHAQRAAAEVLCAQSPLPAFAVDTLIKALDEHLGATNIVAQVLGAQPTLNRCAILAIIRALHIKGWSAKGTNRIFEDENGNLRAFVSSVPRCKLSKPEVLSSISALQDKDKSIRRSGAEKLGTQCKLPEYAIQALIRALDDTDLDVMNSVAQALDAQASLTDSAVLSLLSTFHGKGWITARSAVMRLGLRAMLPERVVIAVINNLGDDLYGRRSEEPLPNSESPMLDAPDMALTVTPKEENREADHSASPILGAGTGSPDLSLVLVEALQDKDRRSRRLVAEKLDALDVQPTLSRSDIDDFIRNLETKKACDRISTKTTLSESPMQALYRSLPGKVQRIRPYEVCGGIDDYPVIVLDKHLHSVFKALPELSVFEIVVLYRCYFFRHGCEHSASLFFKGNRLCFYTERGYGETEPISLKNMVKIISAFRVVQKEVGIPPIRLVNY
ncbi:hypothetical protein BGZ80_001457 [Entomortierella chlamydospora]|uniref:NACHT domain-containing protein n=1 Tax=Entomortierella chlamydospora TaxID=101097 RepID=A0A9P6SXS0_9FUNG|nr:hypothetical protein BGZ80_001457 [Entomortierella chlamydospora]